jgi:lactobin A/cerein 7B family class IIb bacteriocin
MIKIEDINVRELTSTELKSVEGGILPLIVIGGLLLLSGCAAKRPLPAYEKEDSEERE